jgi:Zn-dependent peptidase ImmA (M78 family)
MKRIKPTKIEEYARRLLEEAGVKEPPVDPFKMVDNLEVLYDETTLPPKVWGSTHKRDPAMIFISNEIDNQDRKRFTLAHELGHFRIPHHQSEKYECFYLDIAEEGKTEKEQEREANEFASELLMPLHWFSKDAENEDLTADAIQKLAGKYQASFTSTALKAPRFMYGICATILLKNGAVSYFSRSEDCEEKRLYVQYGTPVPPNSTFNDIKDASKFTIGEKVKTYPDVWFDGGSKSLARYNGKMIEQAVIIPQYNTGIVFISFDDDFDD